MNNNEEEVIFGRNAVLSFLEKEGGASGSEHSPGKARHSIEEQAAVAITRLKQELGEEHLSEQDLEQMAKLSRLPTVRVKKILVAQGVRPDKRLDLIWQLAKSLKIPVQNCDRRQLDEIAGFEERHQGVVALISPAELWSMDNFLFKLNVDRTIRAANGLSMDGYVVAVLDGIEDPHNLGAIIRSAESAGVKALFLPQRRSASISATVAKVSAGALANLPIVRVNNIVQVIETLKENGFWVAGLDLEGAELYTKADLKRPLLVVIGGEGGGISRLVREHCDMLLKIPMLGKTESLNASVAAGILFYEVVRQCQ
jgi:23S rRNA (guanosine2251-2'-O)-methyltransferase